MTGNSRYGHVMLRTWTRQLNIFVVLYSSSPPFLTFQFLLCIIPKSCVYTNSIFSFCLFQQQKGQPHETWHHPPPPRLQRYYLVSFFFFLFFIEFIQQLQSSRQAEDVSIFQLELDDIFFYKPIRIDQLQLVHLYPPQISRVVVSAYTNPFIRRTEAGSRRARQSIGWHTQKEHCHHPPYPLFIPCTPLAPLLFRRWPSSHFLHPLEEKEDHIFTLLPNKKSSIDSYIFPTGYFFLGLRPRLFSHTQTR